MVTEASDKVDLELGQQIFEELNPHHYLMKNASTRYYDLNCLNQNQIRSILTFVMQLNSKVSTPDKKPLGFKETQKSTIRKDVVFVFKCADLE